MAAVTAPAADPPAPPAPPSPHRQRNRLIAAAVAVLVLAVAAVWGWPLVDRSLHTASTDDAYVNGHVTFVAPRVPGQVAKVLVDDNYRVKAGDVLLELDPEPNRVQAALKQAAVASAEADARAADATVRGYLAQARSLRWKLQTASESVDNKIATLNALVAALRSKEATRDRAKADFARTDKLAKTGALTAQEFDLAKRPSGSATPRSSRPSKRCSRPGSPSACRPGRRPAN